MRRRAAGAGAGRGSVEAFLGCKAKNWRCKANGGFTAEICGDVAGAAYGGRPSVVRLAVIDGLVDLLNSALQQVAALGMDPDQFEAMLAVRPQDVENAKVLQLILKVTQIAHDAPEILASLALYFYTVDFKRSSAKYQSIVVSKYFGILKSRYCDITKKHGYNTDKRLSISKTMAQHNRYANKEKHTRRTIKFIREDLLWKGRIGDVTVPVYDQENDRYVGPNILDMVRRSPGAGASPDQSGTWCLRPERDFILPSEKREPGACHPFNPSLISGGTPIGDDGEFVRVVKQSSVSINEIAFKLAVGMHNSVDAAHDLIADKAVLKWRDDMLRARELYDILHRAGAPVPETAEIAGLRPASSISDDIEQEILADACDWLGVSKKLNIKRAPGRPKGAKTKNKNKKSGATDPTRGQFIDVWVDDASKLRGKIIATIGGLNVGTDLETLHVLQLTSILELLQKTNAEVDVDLLTTFLDVYAPDWQEQSASSQEAGAGISDDPYQHLGVTKDMTLDEITKVYRRLMQKLHPDKIHTDESGNEMRYPSWMSQVLSTAFSTIKQQKKQEQDNA